MIKVYTSMRAAMKAANEQGKKIIISNDRAFEKSVGKDNIDSYDKELIKLVDNARVMGDGIVTPYGETTLYNLSTGCKTVINVRHSIEKIGHLQCQIINVGECEGVSMKLIFDMVDNTDIEIVLTHSLLSSVTGGGYTFEVINKGIITDSIYDLIAIIGGGEGE